MPPMRERPLKTRRYLLQGRVITPRLELANATVLVEGQRIAWVKRGKAVAAESTLLTEAGDTVVPGFIDVQVNGLAGHDAASGAAVGEGQRGFLGRRSGRALLD